MVGMGKVPRCACPSKQAETLPEERPAPFQFSFLFWGPSVGSFLLRNFLSSFPLNLVNRLLCSLGNYSYFWSTEFSLRQKVFTAKGINAGGDVPALWRTLRGGLCCTPWHMWSQPRPSPPHPCGTCGSSVQWQSLGHLKKEPCCWLLWALLQGKSVKKCREQGVAEGTLADMWPSSSYLIFFWPKSLAVPGAKGPELPRKRVPVGASLSPEPGGWKGEMVLPGNLWLFPKNWDLFIPPNSLISPPSPTIETDLLWSCFCAEISLHNLSTPFFMAFKKWIWQGEALLLW